MAHPIFKRAFFEVKRLFFPGFDLHTRLRYKKIPPLFRGGGIKTLDAGCGNGCLGFAAYLLGNEVLGVSFEAPQIERNREFYSWLGCQNMKFEVCNLYDLRKLGKKFNQIICSETLEHIAKDAEMVKIFSEILDEDGILHLCCPYALHPSHRQGRTKGPETGGHVRDGYTLQTYEALLKPAGFQIKSYLGLGSNLLVCADRVIRWVRNHFGDLGALPLYLLGGWLAVLLDERIEPRVPFSLYVQAVKDTTFARKGRG